MRHQIIIFCEIFAAILVAGFLIGIFWDKMCAYILKSNGK